MPSNRSPIFHENDVLVSPKRAAEILDVSRSQIDRIALKAGWARVYLSNRERGNVRFRLNQILEFVARRTVNGTE